MDKYGRWDVLKRNAPTVNISFQPHPTITKYAAESIKKQAPDIEYYHYCYLDKGIELIATIENTCGQEPVILPSTGIFEHCANCLDALMPEESTVRAHLDFYELPAREGLVPVFMRLTTFKKKKPKHDIPYPAVYDLSLEQLLADKYTHAIFLAAEHEDKEKQAPAILVYMWNPLPKEQNISPNHARGTLDVSNHF